MTILKLDFNKAKIIDTTVSALLKRLFGHTGYKTIIRGKIKNPKKFSSKRIRTQPKIGKFDINLSLNFSSYRSLSVKKEIISKPGKNTKKGVFLKNFNKKFDYSSREKISLAEVKFGTRKLNLIKL